MKKIVKTILSCALVLLMVAAMLPAAGTPAEARLIKVSPYWTSVTTLAELQSAVEVDGAHVRLENDLTIGSSGTYIWLGHDDVTLDLNGHTISCASSDTGASTTQLVHIGACTNVTIMNGEFYADNPYKGLFAASPDSGSYRIIGITATGFGTFLSTSYSNESREVLVADCSITQNPTTTRSCLVIYDNTTLVLDSVTICGSSDSSTPVLEKEHGNGTQGHQARFVLRNLTVNKGAGGTLVMYRPDNDNGAAPLISELLDPNATVRVNWETVSPSTPLEADYLWYYLYGTRMEVTTDIQYIYAGYAFVSPPQAGERPEYWTILPDDAGYYSGTYSSSTFQNDMYWRDETEGKDLPWATAVFESGHVYSVHIFLTAADGFVFSDKCLYGEVCLQSARAEYYDPDKQMFLHYTFPEVVAAQPSSLTVAAGKIATFQVTSSEAEQYQWQYSDDGVFWTNCKSAGHDTKTFTFSASTSLDGRMYRCVLTKGAKTWVSSPATLTVVGIKTQPTNQTVAVGAQATFKVVATGAASYQWQYSDNGTTWKNCSSSGYNTATFSFKASTALNGRQYRCQIKNGSVTVNSNAAKLTVTTVSKPTITTQPTNQSVTEGSKATFKVVATGATSYQWQWSANGTTWTDCKSTGYNTATFAFTASASLNGRQYRCIVTNSAGSTTSNAAKLTVTSAVTKPTITTQPTNKTVTSGTSVTFKVVATGTGLTYQWQWSADNGKTWKNCTSTGYNTASFSFKASAALNGRMYRCIVKNSAGSATSSGAKLTVSNVKPTITVQPANQSVTAGTKVSFSVIAAGSGLKYQWQWSADGTTWTNCKSTGYNTATFTFTASASLNNRQYRCVVSNSYGSTTSTAGKLTVK